MRWLCAVSALDKFIHFRQWGSGNWFLRLPALLTEDSKSPERRDLSERLSGSLVRGIVQRTGTERVVPPGQRSRRA